MAVRIFRVRVTPFGVLRRILGVLVLENVLILPPLAGETDSSYDSDTNIYNVLDYTSCTIPTTTVDKKVDVVNKSFKPVSEQDRELQEDYDPEIYHGAHVAVQLVGRRLQEEKVLALSEYVGGAIAESKNTRSSHI